MGGACWPKYNHAEDTLCSTSGATQRQRLTALRICQSHEFLRHPRRALGKRTAGGSPCGHSMAGRWSAGRSNGTRPGQCGALELQCEPPGARLPLSCHEVVGVLACRPPSVECPQGPADPQAAARTYRQRRRSCIPAPRAEPPRRQRSSTAPAATRAGRKGPRAVCMPAYEARGGPACEGRKRLRKGDRLGVRVRVRGAPRMWPLGPFHSPTPRL
jgi:hypothetical protein